MTRFLSGVLLVLAIWFGTGKIASWSGVTGFGVWLDTAVPASIHLIGTLSSTGMWCRARHGDTKPVRPLFWRIAWQVMDTSATVLRISTLVIALDGGYIDYWEMKKTSICHKEKKKMTGPQEELARNSRAEKIPEANKATAQHRESRPLTIKQWKSGGGSFQSFPHASPQEVL